MRKISIVNPAAGQGDAQRFVKEGISGEVYVTKDVLDARDFVKTACEEEPETHFFIYGGDGTINEVVNGIMLAGAQSKAAISVIPVGSGNDLLRSFPDKKGCVYTLDVMQYGDSYAVNMLNTGFDADAAEKMSELKTKPFIKGSGAYIMGVLSTLASSYGQLMSFKFTLEDGTVEEAEGEYLLCAVANCSYYGGGFKAAPSASYDDGLMDVLLVNKVSRPTFFRIISTYKAGKHIDPETKTVLPKYADIIELRRCTEVSMSGLKSLCVDGEIHPIEQTEIKILKKQIRLVI